MRSSNNSTKFTLFWIVKIVAFFVCVADAFPSRAPASCFLCVQPFSRISRYARRGVALDPSADTSASTSVKKDDDDTNNLHQDRCTLENIQRLTQDALLLATTLNDDMDTEQSLKALEELADLCVQRLPYNFDDNQQNQSRISSSSGGCLIAHQPALLPRNATNSISDLVGRLALRGLLSTNPDSVDGLPSFHLNLVSNGQAAAVATSEVDDDNNPETSKLHLFQQSLANLLEIVRPYIYDELLPHVRQQLNDPNLEVGDIFLRRYGSEIVADQPSRHGISAHYDVLARATTVVALDATAATGRNGLYATAAAMRGGVGGSGSNHAALRRFFPLQRGDAVTHTWDLLHGVDVEAGLDRTSLIVWFVTTKDDDPQEQQQQQQQQQQTQLDSPRPPRWLTEHGDLETNNDGVAQFVLGSAMESCSGDSTDDSTTATIIDLYLRSASQGNTFALTRLGSLLSAAAENEEENCRGGWNEAAWAQACDLTKRFRSDDDRYAGLHLQLLGHCRNDDGSSIDGEDDPQLSAMDLAKTFWLEGAIRGNPLAQLALADELMYETTTVNSYDSKRNDNRRITAAILFGLAAQQGLDDERALDSLTRAVQYDVAVGEYSSEQDFTERSLVAQVALRACCQLEVG